MSPAVVTAYPEKIAASICVAGISSFITFPELTDGFRRDVRRAERIVRPLFFVQGKSDRAGPLPNSKKLSQPWKTQRVSAVFAASDEGRS